MDAEPRCHAEAPAAGFKPRTMHTQPNLTPAPPISIVEVGRTGGFYVRHARVGRRGVGVGAAWSEPAMRTWVVESGDLPNAQNAPPIHLRLEVDERGVRLINFTLRDSNPAAGLGYQG